MGQFDRIETDRLYLQTLNENDAESMLEYHSDPIVTRHIPWPVRDLAMVKEALAKYMTFKDLLKEDDYLMLGVYRKEDNQLLGQVNAMYRSENNKLAEFGYVVNPRFGKHGYATEAVRGLINALFASGKFHRVMARMDARNSASAALCTRLGLRLEAHHLQDDWFKEEWTDTYIYAVLKDEWDKQ
mgnify:CR=1 FL=1